MADHEKMVYMSAVDGGSKLQFTYKNPSQVYPDDARLTRPVKLNTPYRLTVAAQGKRLNVWIDGELSLAYEMPVERRRGAMALIAFDAAVKIDACELRELPAGASLAASVNDKPLSPEAAERAEQEKKKPKRRRAASRAAG